MGLRYECLAHAAGSRRQASGSLPKHLPGLPRVLGRLPKHLPKDFAFLALSTVPRGFALARQYKETPSGLQIGLLEVEMQ